MRKEDFYTSFRLQCLDVKELSLIQFDRSLATLKSLGADEHLKKVDRIIATGCGDSHLAAASAAGAFEYFVPEIAYEAPTAMDFTRFMPMKEEPNTLVIGISVSGSPSRVVETLERAKKYGCLTFGLTDKVDSRVGQSAKYVYHTNTPAGDNVAGLRTYYASMVSLFVLAAYIKQLKTGKEQMSGLKALIGQYRDEVYAGIEETDEICFQTALSWKDKTLFEVTADGPLFLTGKFISAKMAELSGDVCANIDSENYFHVNGMMYPGTQIAEINLLMSDEENVDRIVEAINAQVGRDKRSSIVFCDKQPSELGVTQEVGYCPLPRPPKGHRYLLPLFAYLPAALLAAYRAAVIGEPFFRGGKTVPFMTLSKNPVRVV